MTGVRISKLERAHTALDELLYGWIGMGGVIIKMSRHVFRNSMIYLRYATQAPFVPGDNYCSDCVCGGSRRRKRGRGSLQILKW